MTPFAEFTVNAGHRGWAKKPRNARWSININAKAGDISPTASVLISQQRLTPDEMRALASDLSTAADEVENAVSFWLSASI